MAGGSGTGAAWRGHERQRRLAAEDAGSPVVYSGPPLTPPPVPPIVAALAGDRRTRPVWENELGGLTFAVDGDAGPELYIKWAPAGTKIEYAAEAARLAWAAPFTPVPEVVEVGGTGEASWLVMSALPGRSAVDRRCRDEPRVAVRAIGEGLRALHDSLPVGRCPFAWSADDRADLARRRAASGGQAPDKWHRVHRHLSVDQALALVAGTPLVDRLVVCHGDACAPNTLIDEGGRWCGHVDFERMGVADRWADIAIATWSCDWNYGPGWHDQLLAAYGTGPDPDRTAYYRLLWDLS